MSFLLLILLLTTTVYAAKVFKWRNIWQSSKDTENRLTTQQPFLSVVVAAKNESGQIAKLIHSLQNQKLKSDCFEVILVNDHSTDQTAEIIESAIRTLPHFRLINSVLPGKKAALRQGISIAKGEIIVTTDADCIHHEQWLSSMANYQSTHNTDLIIAPVSMVAQKSYLQHLFELEFLALQLTTAASALNGQPIMCNAANMAIRKSHYGQTNLKDEYASGDDMFLLIHLKKENANIRFLKNNHALVTTSVPSTLIAYLKQRSRWLRKASGYSQTNIHTTAVIMLAGNLAWPAAILIGLATLNAAWITVALILFAIKYTADYHLLKSGEEFFNIRTYLRHVLALSILYPLMIVSIGVTTLLKNKKKW